MLETFTSISSSWFHFHTPFSEEFFSHSSSVEDIRCPQPRRTASPAFVIQVNNRVEADWEVCEELKQILLQSQLPKISVTTNMEHNIPERMGSISFNPFYPTQSPLIDRPKYKSGKQNSDRDNFGSENDFGLDSSDSDNDNDISETDITLRRKALRRPKLGVSTTNIIGLNRTEPVMTPPLRTHNPLPLNLQFRKVSEGAEFGLFSISPPSHDDEDVLLRRERFKRRHNKGVNEHHHHHPHLPQSLPSPLTNQPPQQHQYQEISDMSMDVLQNCDLSNDGLNNDVGGDSEFGFVLDL